MKLTNRRVVSGLAAGGLAAAALAGGGVALASTGAAPAPTPAASAVPYSGGCANQFGGMWGMHGIWSGRHPVMQAAAGFLGLSQTQLQTQLQAGKTLADVATAQGKPVSGLKDTILAAMTSRIKADTTLTAGQKAAMLSHLSSRLDAMINMDMDMDMSHRPGMGMSGTNWPGGMGMWR
jgi:hypothetical protein